MLNFDMFHFLTSLNMPKVITAKQLLKILKEYGYEEHHQRGSHLMLKHRITGKFIVIPMHSKDLWIGLTLKILAQAGIDPNILR